MPTMSGTYVQDVSWSANVTAFRAPAEEMTSKVRMFQIAVYSKLENPAFYVSQTRLAAMITRENLRQQQAIFARYRQIRQTLAECDDIIMQVYQNKSASFDRMFDNYSQALRGGHHVDPVNNWNIELPTGYDNAWTNGTDYVFSGSPSYNPNVGRLGRQLDTDKPAGVSFGEPLLRGAAESAEKKAPVITTHAAAHTYQTASGPSRS
jgi:hypothetical protein